MQQDPNPEDLISVSARSDLDTYRILSLGLPVDEILGVKEKLCSNRTSES